MPKISVFSLILFSLFLSFKSAAHQGATGIIKQRMDRFQASQQQLKSIVAAAHVQEFATVERLAGLLAEWGRIMPDYFPEGSNQPPSEAAPTIWSDFSGFSAAAARYNRSATQLAAASKSGQEDAVFAAIKAVGDSCKSCHKTYRVK